MHGLKKRGERDKSRLSEEGNTLSYDKEILDEAISETVLWLDGSQTVTTEEYQDKQKGLDGTANPIMVKMYGGGSGNIK